MTDVTGDPRIFEHRYYERLFAIEERHWWSRGMRRAMVALLGARFGAAVNLRVLDIGCGTGYLMQFLEDFSAVNDTVGIDVAVPAIEFCRQRGLRQAIQADASALPFGEGSFDLVTCVDTIQHLASADAERTLAESARVLRPGGVLFLRTNSSLGHVRLEGVDSNQYRRYSREAVVSMLAEVGFEVERATYLNMVPGLWGALRERGRGRVQHAESEGPGLAIDLYPWWLGWLNGLMAGVLALEAWVVGRSGIDLPFGHAAAFVARTPAPHLD